MQFKLPFAVAALSVFNLGANAGGFNGSNFADPLLDPKDVNVFLQDDADLAARQFLECEKGFKKCGTGCCEDNIECCGLNCCKPGAVCMESVCCMPDWTPCGMRCCEEGSHCEDGLCYEGDSGRGFREILPAAQIATAMVGGWAAWWMMRG